MSINWKKTLLIGVDLMLAGYLACAFTVWNKPDETARVCTKANIVVDDESTSGFINAGEITKRLKREGLYPLGMQMQNVDARKIEERLKASAFVKSAECYKTQDGEVYISITQLLPVIRVKADNGDDYYLDDKDCIMPNSSYTSDLIIATGNIPRWFARRYISPLGRAIMANDLWRNMVEQINVLPDRSIEIVPRIGSHIVHLGTLPDDRNSEKRAELISAFVDKKLTRLAKFYKYGLSQAGWNKYYYVDIEFDNQIICKRHDVSEIEASLTPEEAAPETASDPQPAATPSAAPATEKKPETEKKKDDTAAPKKQESAAKKQESTAKKKDSTTKKSDNTAKKDTKSDAKKSDSSSKKTESSSSKKSDSSTKKSDSSSKKSDSTSKKSDSSKKKADSEVKKPSSSTKKSGSTAKENKKSDAGKTSKKQNN